MTASTDKYGHANPWAATEAVVGFGLRAGQSVRRCHLEVSIGPTFCDPLKAVGATDCALTRAFRWSDRKILHSVALLLWLVVTAMGPAMARSDDVVTIESPVSEETIHDNSGNVPVTVSIKNGDALVAGGAIQALIDGQPYGPRQHTSSFTLEGVERGEHSLQVQLVDSAGIAIASSDAVKFYMWQASALFPGRKR